MSIELIILPILAMASGIASLFIDPKDPKSKWAKPLMLTLVILSALATIYVGYQSQINSDKRDKEFNGKNQQIQAKVDAILALIKRGASPSIATIATSDQISQSNEANKILNSYISTMTKQDFGRRQVITIQYFPKTVEPDINPNTVRSNLQKLGFNFTVKEPIITKTRTNSIWFGSKVNIEDVKLVAYTFISAGVQIRSIEPFDKNKAEEKASLIQVGAAIKNENRPVLSVSKIHNATEFVRKE